MKVPHHVPAAWSRGNGPGTVKVRQEAGRPEKRPEGGAKRKIIAPGGHRTSAANSDSFRNV